MSIFGNFSISRRAYHISQIGRYYPLDEHLNFPKQKLSYSLQNIIAQSSTSSDYRSSVSLVNELLGLNLQGTQSKRLAQDLAPLVDAYYDNQVGLSEQASKEEGTHLAFGNDGKGVPIVARERKAGASKSEKQQEKGRLMKGQKRGIKKQATVSVSFSFTPKVRDSETILRGLFREQTPPDIPQVDEKDRRFSKNVHKRAFMCNQKKGIDYALQNLVDRNPSKDKKIIALVDCGTGLESGILQSIKEQGLQDNLDAIIADIVHVSEYIWKAANAILGEKYKGRSDWVRAVMKDLLESKTQKVIADLKANLDKTNLSPPKQEQVQVTIRYLSNHAHKMDYKSYLQKGYPISTGLIEGCCGHLIKDRMENSGMRWTIQGAQNMIDLRALHKNGDWNEFIEFVKKQNNTNMLKIAA